MPPNDPLERLRRKLAEIDARRSSERMAAPRPRESAPAGRGFGGFRETMEDEPRARSWSPRSLGSPDVGESGARVMPDMRIEAPNPAGNTLSSAIRYRMHDQPRAIKALDDADQGMAHEMEPRSRATWNRLSAPGEFEGGFSAGMDSPLEMAGLSTLTMADALIPGQFSGGKPIRRYLEDRLAKKIGRRASEVELGGGDPSSTRFSAGVITGGMLPAAGASGAVIGAATAGARAAGGALAANTRMGTGMVANALRAAGGAVARSPKLTAYGASAGLTALTTDETDGTLSGLVAPNLAGRYGMASGRLAAVGEDLALNVVGDGVFGAVAAAKKALERLSASKLSTSTARADRKAALAASDRAPEQGGSVYRPSDPAPLPVERRLPSGRPAGVRPDPNAVGGRILTTEPPASMDPNATPVPNTHPLRAAQAKHWEDVAAGQNRSGDRREAEEVARQQSEAQASATRQRGDELEKDWEQAKVDADDPKKMPFRELLRRNAARGVGFGLAGVAAMEAYDSMDDDIKTENNEELLIAMTSLGLFGVNARRAKLGGRTTKIINEGGVGVPQAARLAHGTNRAFSVFDDDLLAEGGAMGIGKYFTVETDVAGGSIKGMIANWDSEKRVYGKAEMGYSGYGVPKEAADAAGRLMWADQNIAALEQRIAENPSQAKALQPTLQAMQAERAAGMADYDALLPEDLAPNVRLTRAIAEQVFDADEAIEIHLGRDPERSDKGDYYDTSGELAQHFGKNPDLSRLHESIIAMHGPDAGEAFFENLAERATDNGSVDPADPDWGRRLRVVGNDVRLAIGAAIDMADGSGATIYNPDGSIQTPDANKVLKHAGYEAITHMDVSSTVNNHTLSRGATPKFRTWILLGDETDQMRSAFGPAETAPALATPAEVASPNITRRELATAGVGAAAGVALSEASESDESGMAFAAAGAGLSSGSVRARVKSMLAGLRKPSGKLAGISDPLPVVTPRRYTSPSNGRQAPLKTPTSQHPDDFLNYEARYQAMKADPTGRMAVNQQMQRTVEQRGNTFKKPVSFEDVREQATRLNLNPDELISLAKKRGLTPAEQLATSDVIVQNIDNMIALREKLDDPATLASDHALIRQNQSALELQTNELLWNQITNRTEAGRNLVFQKIAASRTMDPSFWAAQAAKNLGSESLLSADHVAQIHRLIKDKNRLGLSSYVASLQQGQARRVFVTAYKAGLLTNPATHTTNIASNTLMASAEVVKDAPATVVDAAVTGMLNSLLGAKTVRRSRDFNSKLLTQSLAGAREGVKDMRQIMQGRDPSRASALKYDQVSEVRLGDGPVAKMAEMYLNGPFRLLRAADAPFKMAAFERSLGQQQRLLGLPEKPDLNGMVAQATNDMVARAMADAEVATFQNKSVLGSVAQGAKRALATVGGTPGAIAGEVLLPFTQTPGAVAGAVVRYSPLGMARASMDAVDLVLKTHKARRSAAAIRTKTAAGENVSFDTDKLNAEIELLQEIKNNMVDRAGRSVVGTALMGLGMAMASAGILTVKPGRTDRVGRDTGETMGDPGNSIDFGPLNAQIDRLSPVANLLLLGAYVVKGYNEDNPEKERERLEAKTDRTLDEETKLTGMRQQLEEEGATLFGSSWGQAIAAGIASIGGVITEQPVFSGVTRVQDALNDPVRAAKSAGYAQVGSFVPAGIGAAARLTDGTRRAPTTLGETLKARIPGLSKTVPSKLDALGSEITETAGVRLANLASPARLSTDRTTGDSPESQVRRLLQQYDVTLTRTNTRRKDGETAAAGRSRQSETGQSIVNRIMSLRGELEQYPEDQRADVLKTEIGRARSNANRKIKARKRAETAGVPFDDDVFDGRP